MPITVALADNKNLQRCRVNSGLRAVQWMLLCTSDLCNSSIQSRSALLKQCVQLEFLGIGCQS